MSAATVAQTVTQKLAEVRKLIAYLVAVAGVLTTAGVLPVDAQGYIAYAVAVLGAVGLYRVPNTDADPESDSDYQAAHAAD